MKDIILNKKLIPYYIIAVLLFYISMTGGKEVVEVEIPIVSGSVQIDKPVPVVRVDTFYVDNGNYDKGYKTVVVKDKVNEELLSKYKEAVKENDSLRQENLYKEAVTERLYIEKLDDSIQTVKVESVVVGTLKSQNISYETKPRKIPVKINKTKPIVYIGAFGNLPTIENAAPTVGLQLHIANKKRVLTVGFDNVRNVHIGYAIKLF